MKCETVIISNPGGLTRRLQSLDISINKVFKFKYTSMYAIELS